MGFVRKATWGVWPSLVGHPHLILSLLTDSKLNSKRRIKYLIYGFYGRLQEENGRVFVPWRAKVFLHFWKSISALQKKSLFPSQLPFPLSISLNTTPPSPKSSSHGSSLQTALSNPISILLPDKSLAKAPNLLIVKLEPPLSHVCVCVYVHVCV